MPFRRKRSRQGHLTPAQQDVVARLERGEISAAEAARLLDETARKGIVVPRGADDTASPDEREEGPPETPGERTARELVERIAREAYGDPPE